MFQKELLEIERILRRPPRTRFKLTFQDPHGREISVPIMVENVYRDKIAWYHYVIDRLPVISEKFSIEFPEFHVVDAPIDERKFAKRLLRLLAHERFVDRIPVGGFALVLLQRLLLANSHTNRGIYFFLLSVAGYAAYLKLENSMGYHFHYVEIKKRDIRTNVIFTFNPAKPDPPHNLYWEHHDGGSRVHPERWSTDRCEAIHTAAVQKLPTHGKGNFRRPGKKSAVLWP